MFLFMMFVFISVHPYQSRFGNNLSRKRRFFLKKLRKARQLGQFQQSRGRVGGSSRAARTPPAKQRAERTSRIVRFTVLLRRCTRRWLSQRESRHRQAVLSIGYRFFLIPL